MAERIRMWAAAAAPKSSEWVEIVVVAVGIVLCCYLWSEKKGNAPRRWPLVGMLPSIVMNFQRIYEWETEMLRANGGTYVFRGAWKGKQDCVVSCDPRNIEYVLRTNFSNFPKGADFHAEFHDLLGDGIFNADADEWRLQRKMASLHFNSRTFRRFMADAVQDIVQNKLIPLLTDAANRKATVDLQDIFLRYTFDNTCTVVFGRNPGCLALDLPQVPFANAFDKGVEATFYRQIMPRGCWKMLRLLKLGKERQFHKALKPLRDFMDDLIAYKKETIGNGVASKDLLSRLMEEEGRYDDKFLRDTVMNFVIAGRDTSGVALAWFFWLLYRHPRVEEKVVKELNDVLSRRSNLEAEKPFTGRELQECVYLHAALSETLRLYPSIPHDHKGALANDILPDGTCIEPGMRFLYSIYSQGRMESIWGPDCMEFKPERWIEEEERGHMTVRVKRESPYKFMAFNAGARVCLGKEMAYAQMKAAAAAVVTRFRVRVNDNAEVKPRMSLVLAIKNGLPVTLQQRIPTI